MMCYNKLMDNQNNTFKSEAEIMETIAAVRPAESSVDDEPLIQPVKPEPMAPPVPEKKEINVVAIVLGVIAGIFAIVAIVFMVKYFTEKPKCEVEAVVQEPSEAEKEAITANVMARDYKEVYDLVSGIASKNDKRHLSRSGGTLIYTAGDTGVYVDLRYALGGSMITSQESLDGDIAAIESDLVAAGFQNIGIVPLATSAGPRIYGYLNEEADIVCNVFENSEFIYGNSQEYVYYNCGKTDWTWLTEDELKMIGELGIAYRDKTGNDSVSMMGFEDVVIHDSKYEPYQTIRIPAMNGGGGEFYRVSPDSEWRFFAVTQSALECSDYNTDDLKKAFLGEVCHNGNEMSTVQL